MFSTPRNAVSAHSFRESPDTMVGTALRDHGPSASQSRYAIALGKPRLVLFWKVLARAGGRDRQARGNAADVTASGSRAFSSALPRWSASFPRAWPRPARR